MTSTSITLPGLEVSSHGSVRQVTLDRPEKLNAVNADLHESLSNVWQAIAADPQARAVVITGAGKAFSAGGDREFLERIAQDAQWRYENMRQARRIVQEMIAFPLPVIAAVNGPAVGLGCSVALLSDLVLMSESAFFADPHVAIGLVAADGGALCWPLLTSLIRAKEYLFTGDRIDARSALELGFANRVVAPEELLEAAHALAERLAAQPAQAMRDTKRAVNIHLQRAVGAVLDFAFSAEAETFTSADFRDRLAQFGR
jgi:enoyl-CoA hydratase